MVRVVPLSSSNQPMAQSLVQTLRQRYTECVSASTGSKWKICILDAETERRLNSVVKQYDLLEHSVQQIERIDAQRAPLPRLEAVYILSPSPDNIARVIADFVPARAAIPASRKTPAQPASGGPKYAAAHLYFIDSLSDSASDQLLNSPVRDYLKTFKEIYLSFWALESQVFSLRQPELFWTLYGPSSLVDREAFRQWDSHMSSMAQLLNVCATLSEFPEIRYYDPKGASRAVIPGPGMKDHPTAVLADKLDRMLKQYQKDNEGALSEGDTGRPRSVLFITDRSMDVAAPFLHEFTYQAMCNDLLPIEDGSKYKHSFRNEQGAMEDIEVNLNDDDKVWVDVRHMHMKDALDTLVAAFRQFSSEHGQPGGSSINDLKDMLANLPGIKESKEKLSLHLSLAEQCMALFEQKKLSDTALVEQACSTGTTAEGKTPKTLVEEMVPLLDDRSVSVRDKVRIIALYIIYRDGVPDEDRKRLYQHARLGMPEVDAVNNLVRLGQEVAKDSSKKRKALFKQVASDEAYDISRYQPAIKIMVEEYLAGRLDRYAFPSIGAPAGPSSAGSSLRAGANSPAPGSGTSLRSARPRWTAGSKSRLSAEPRQRVLVFVAGGMTYSEIRSIYQLSAAHNKDVYIGSTHVLTPDTFVSDLARLDRPGGARSQPPPASSAALPRHHVPSQRPRPAHPPQDSRAGDARRDAKPIRPAQLDSRAYSFNSNREPPPQPSRSPAPRPGLQQSNSVADQDFVPQVHVAPSNNASPARQGIKHNLSSMSTYSALEPEKKKKGLFGRLKS